MLPSLVGHYGFMPFSSESVFYVGSCLLSSQTRGTRFCTPHTRGTLPFNVQLVFWAPGYHAFCSTTTPHLLPTSGHHVVTLHARRRSLLLAERFHTFQANICSVHAVRYLDFSNALLDMDKLCYGVAFRTYPATGAC